MHISFQRFQILTLYIDILFNTEKSNLILAISTEQIIEGRKDAVKDSKPATLMTRHFHIFTSICLIGNNFTL